jgi:hypothetical protein
MAKVHDRQLKIEVGSGNVFADLGLSDAVELDLKVQLAVKVVRLLNARGLEGQSFKHFSLEEVQTR